MSTQSNLLINDHIGDTAIFSAPLGLVKKRSSGDYKGHLQFLLGENYLVSIFR